MRGMTDPRGSVILHCLAICKGAMKSGYRWTPYAGLSEWRNRPVQGRFFDFEIKKMWNSLNDFDESKE